MMDDSKKLVDSIIQGIQEKKGRGIRVIDLRDTAESICQYLVICEAGSPSQVEAVCESAHEFAQRLTGEKPSAVDGLRNCIWVAMDYTDVAVHIFLPDARTFYDLDHLWDDAPQTLVPDLD